MSAAVIGLAACTALLALLVVGLLRAHAEVLRALHSQGIDLDPSRPADVGLPVARPGLAPIDGPGAFPGAADLVGVTLDGDDVVVGVSGEGSHLLLAFLSSQCLTCAAFWDDIAAGRGPGLPAGLELVAVTKGPEVEVLGDLRRRDLDEVAVVMSSQAWRDYEVPVSPYFVHVVGGRVVGTGAASTWHQVQGLVTTSLAGGLRPSSTGHQGGRVEPRAAQDRAAHVDAELSAAGILPGDPRLWGGAA